MNQKPLRSDSQSRLAWGSLLSLFSAILYGVSPLDILPDLIPVLGLVDDALVVPILAGMALLLWIRKEKLAKAQPPVIDVVEKRA